jgi:DNA transposition AAA+ family ATPase
MKKAEKNKIKELFLAKCQQMGLSQNEGAIAAGTRGTTVSQVFNGKYPANDDAVYKLLGIWVDFKQQNWNGVETNNFKKITHFLDFAQENSDTCAIIGLAGCGKTFAFKRYSQTRPNVYLLCCNEFWNRKLFLKELLSIMGKDASGFTVGEMMATAIEGILKSDNPLIILDEADKLSDQVLYFFITLYNTLEDQCGLVLAATHHLEKRIKKGLSLNRKGYSEIYSRIGRRFIECKNTRVTDIAAICMANGVADKAEIEQIANECEGDLRRVKRGIHKAKIKEELAA